MKIAEACMCVIIMLRTSFRVNLHSIVCLIVKKLLAPSRRHIWSLSDSNGIRTFNYLVRKRTLNRLAKVFIYKLSGCGFESRYCHLRRRIQNPVRHLKRSLFCENELKPVNNFRKQFMSYVEWVDTTILLLEKVF